MSQRQSNEYTAGVQRYLRRRPRAVTIQRIADGGLLLPCASVWALTASAHMTFTMLFVGRYDYWFSFAGPIDFDGLHERLIFEWTWWYAVALLIAGILSWDHWKWRASHPDDRHLTATLLGVALSVLAFPTWLETLSIVGPALGLLALANIGSVLCTGRPLGRLHDRRPRRS